MRNHWGLVGRYLPASVEDDLWAWSVAIEETKDDMRDVIKGTIDGAVDTLGKKDVKEDLEIRSDKPGPTSTSNQPLPTSKLQPSDSRVNQTHQIMFKEAMVQGLDSTVAQQLLDFAKIIVALSDKEERNQTSHSHHNISLLAGYSPACFQSWLVLSISRITLIIIAYFPWLDRYSMPCLVSTTS